MGGLGRHREAVTHCFCSDVTEGQVCVGICAKKCCCFFYLKKDQTSPNLWRWCVCVNPVRDGMKQGNP